TGIKKPALGGFFVLHSVIASGPCVAVVAALGYCGPYPLPSASASLFRYRLFVLSGQRLRPFSEFWLSVLPAAVAWRPSDFLQPSAVSAARLAAPAGTPVILLRSYRRCLLHRWPSAALSLSGLFYRSVNPAAR